MEILDPPAPPSMPMDDRLRLRLPDLHPLHHADVFMLQHMAMHDEVAFGDGIVIGPEGHRARRGLIDVLGVLAGLRLRGRNQNGAMFRPAVDGIDWAPA
jgi:hypothetical protein